MTSVVNVPDPNSAVPNSAVHADAVRVLTAWEPADPGQQALRQAFLGFLAARPDGCARSCAPGHLTASAVVLSTDGEHALLTLHPRVGRWVQLGGHCEERDAGLAAAALREATEESGIADLQIDPVPLHLDVHPITCSLGAPTRHFDVRFLLRAPAGATPVRSAESADLAWWPVNALPPDVAPTLRCLSEGTRWLRGETDIGAGRSEHGRAGSLRAPEQCGATHHPAVAVLLQC